MRLCLIGIGIALLAPAEIDVAHADCCDLEGCGSGDPDGKRPGSFEANPGSDPRNCIELVRLDSHIATACLPSSFRQDRYHKGRQTRPSRQNIEPLKERLESCAHLNGDFFDAIG